MKSPQEHKPTHDDHPHIAMPPPALYLGGLLVGYGLERALPLPPLTLPGGVTIATLLLISGALLAASAVLQMRRARTTVLPHRAASTLLDNGVFRLSRNPIYVGFTCLYLAMSISQASIGMLIMLAPVLWVMHTHIIAEEERFHAKQFGDQWQRYRQRVRRWL